MFSPGYYVDPHIYGDAEYTRMQLAQFDALVKQMRSTITSGIGWFEEFYVSKQRLSVAARAYMRKGEDVPEDVAMFEDVLYGPYLKYRWREEGSKRAAIYTVQLGLIPDEERSTPTDDDQDASEHPRWPLL